MRTRLKVLVALCFAGLTTGAVRAQARPPIVLVTIDTLRADYLPAWGRSDVRTPALQALARDGVVFRQAVTTVPLTLPAHASLMTATYPHYHGLRDNSGNRLSREIPTAATLLKARGYRTAAFLGASVLDRAFGLDRGFDHYGDRFESARVLGLTAERRGSEVVDEALGWLEGTKGPFFVWIHLYDPHWPYAPPEGPSSYQGEIEYSDVQLGRLLDLLRAKGVYRDSVVAVLSDHGEDLNQHREATHGLFVYDTVMHIPFFLKLPDNRFAGRGVEEQVRIIDVLPTLLQILGAPSPESAQGTGLLRWVRGRGTQLESYMETLYPNLHFGWAGLFGLRTERYKFIDAPEAELYDLAADPGETRNLYEREQALANRLRTRLNELRSRFQGRPAEAAPVDAELRERLKSLGYATLSHGVAISEDFSGLADPKSKVDVYAGIARGMQAFVQEDHRRAEDLFLQTLEQDQSVPLAHNYLGSTRLALGDPARAVESYRRALELAPGRAEFASNLAYAYLESGDLEAAEEGFRLVTRLQAGDWQAWQLLGVARMQRGRLDEALQALDRSLKLNPGRRETLNNMGLVYQRQGKFLLALEVFRRLVEAAPEDPELWGSLANSYQGAGLADSAAQAFRRALSLDPARAQARYNYGNLLASQGKWEEAAVEFRRATRSDPEFADAFHNLSVALETLGRDREADRARQEYERLAAKRPRRQF